MNIKLFCVIPQVRDATTVAIHAGVALAVLPIAAAVAAYYCCRRRPATAKTAPKTTLEQTYNSPTRCAGPARGAGTRNRRTCLFTYLFVLDAGRRRAPHTALPCPRAVSVLSLPTGNRRGTGCRRRWRRR